MKLREAPPRQLGLLAIVLFALVVVPFSAVFDSSTRSGTPAPATGGTGGTAGTGPDATAHIGPGPATAMLRDGRFALRLRITPNRASARNVVSVQLTSDGRPVDGARVNVIYGMPAMNMGDGLSNVLPQRAAGAYSLREPILGMVGLWTLRFEVSAPSSDHFSVSADDELR